jgi:hypothetical protein
VVSRLRPTSIITMSHMNLRAMNLLGVASMMHPHDVHAVHGPPVDLTSSAITIIIGALTITVMVMIAVWQQREIVCYRKADRAQQDADAELERLQSERRTRRDYWRPVIDEIRVLLVPLEEIAAQVLEQGPVDHSTIGVDLLTCIQWRLQCVDRRCPTSLHDPLLAVATAVAVLGGIAVPSDVEVTDDYYRALNTIPPAPLTGEVLASVLGAKAVAQYRAAKDLQAALATAWKAIEMESGVGIWQLQ